MATNKTYTVAGVSRNPKSGFKVRWANDMTRVKILQKTDKDIDLIELKHAMTKLDAVKFLIKIDFDNGNKLVRACLEAELEKRLAEEAPKVKRPRKAKTATKPAKAKKPSLEKIRAKKEVPVESEQIEVTGVVTPEAPATETVTETSNVEDTPF